MWHEQNIWEVVSYSEEGMVPSHPHRNSQRMKRHAQALDRSAPDPLLYVILFSLVLLWNSWMCEQVGLLLLCFIFGSFPSVGLVCSTSICSFLLHCILFCYKLLTILITTYKCDRLSFFWERWRALQTSTTSQNEENKWPWNAQQQLVKMEALPFRLREHKRSCMSWGWGWGREQL